jgi:Spy/CpxP family protein refolding chaperone
LAARFSWVVWKYESIAYALTLKHVGVLYQAMYRTATALGLFPCAIGGCDAERFAQAVPQRRLAMHTFMKGAVVLLLVPAVVGATAQQKEHAVAEGATVKLLLLRQKSVQKELELGADVVEKIMAFTHSQSEAAKKIVGLGEAERKEAFEKLARQNDKFLTDTLSEKQGKRLHQIMMQFTALTQLTKPEMVRELNLSDEQVKKLKDMRTEARKALSELIEAKERAGKSEKLAKLREETRTKILAVLTDEQKAKVREIAGPPFEGEIVFEEPD